MKSQQTEKQLRKRKADSKVLKTLAICGYTKKGFDFLNKWCLPKTTNRLNDMLISKPPLRQVTLSGEILEKEKNGSANSILNKYQI
jgi:hypothetical protein